MRELGFFILDTKKEKDVYKDGKDVLESRRKFLRKMVTVGFLNPDNAPTEEAELPPIRFGNTLHLNGEKRTFSLTSPPGRGEVLVLIVCVCLSVCYRSSGRYGYLTSQTKVSTESARRNKQNKGRNFAKNV